MKQTLLQVGDKVRIREDIKEDVYYSMKTYNYNNCYIYGKMAEPGKLVTIKQSNAGYRLEEEDFFTYTDEMFDTELIDYLYEEYLENNK